MSVRSFDFPFTEQTEKSFFRAAHIDVDRYAQDENGVKLLLKEKAQTPAVLHRLQVYVDRLLSPFGAQLRTIQLDSRSRLVLAGRANEGDSVAISVSVGVQKARDVFEFLFQRGEMSSANREAIEPRLHELESSFQRAPRMNDVFMEERKFIDASVRGDVDVIKTHAPDAATATKWVHDVAREIGFNAGLEGLVGRKRVPGFETTIDYVRENVWPSCRQTVGTFDAFFHALVGVANAYAGKSGLERVLVERGSKQASLELIRQTIEDLLLYY